MLFCCCCFCLFVCLFAVVVVVVVVWGGICGRKSAKMTDKTSTLTLHSSDYVMMKYRPVSPLNVYTWVSDDIDFRVIVYCG